MEETFDLETFERALEAKIEAHPSLGGPLTAAVLATFLIAAVGLLLLVDAWRRRAGASAAPPPGPPERPRWGLADAAAVLLFMPVIGAVVLAARDVLGLTGIVAGTIVPSVAVNLALGALVFALAGWRGQAARALGFTPAAEGSAPAPLVGLRYVTMAFPIYYGASFLSKALFRTAGLERSANPAAAVFLTTDSVGDLAAIVLVALAIAPLVEEIIFRGFLYPALRARLGWRGGVAASAAFFALVHPPSDMLAIFFLGAALALAYERSGSLYASITAHALNNAWGIAMLAIERYIYRA